MLGLGLVTTCMMESSKLVKIHGPLPCVCLYVMDVHLWRRTLYARREEPIMPGNRKPVQAYRGTMLPFASPILHCSSVLDIVVYKYVVYKG